MSQVQVNQIFDFPLNVESSGQTGSGRCKKIDFYNFDFAILVFFFVVAHVAVTQY